MAKIKEVLEDLLNQKGRPLDEVIDRHFAPGYQQRTDGQWSDRDEFVQHVSRLRAIVVHAEVTVEDEFHQGHRYADRHIVRIRKTDGVLVEQEVYLFGALADDGRFQTVHETTFMLSGAEADRSVGTA